MVLVKPTHLQVLPLAKPFSLVAGKNIYSICFREDGKYTKDMDAMFDGKKKGKWFIDGNTILFYTKKGGKEVHYCKYSNGNIKLTNQATDEEVHFTKI